MKNLAIVVALLSHTCGAIKVAELSRPAEEMTVLWHVSPADGHLDATMEIALEEGNPSPDFPINKSHDSYMYDVRDDETKKTDQYAYDCGSHSRLSCFKHYSHEHLEPKGKN